MKMKKQKIEKKILKKLIILICLLIFFLLDIIYVSSFRNKNIIAPEKSKTEAEVCITNLEDYAVPSLGEDAGRLEQALKIYCRQNQPEASYAEIFYVTIPDEKEQIIFFARLYPDEKIVELLFDFDTDKVLVSACEYTEEEIWNEAWMGNIPAIRDES